MNNITEKEHQIILNKFISYYTNIKNQREIYDNTLNHYDSIIDKQEFILIGNIDNKYQTILKHIMNKCVRYMITYNVNFFLLGSFYYEHQDQLEDIRAEIVRELNVQFITH